MSKKMLLFNFKQIDRPWELSFRWIMLVLIWLLYSCFGLISQSISPLITPILNDLKISYSQMGLILGAWQFTYIFVSLIGGTLIDIWGIRLSLFTGIFLISLSACLRFFANNFFFMFFCVALFGIGGPMISIGAPKTIATWLKGKDRSIGVGIYTTGPSIGGLFALVLTNSVIMPLVRNSWRSTFVFYGLIALAASLIWLIFARDVKGSVIERSNNISIIEVFIRIMKIRNVQLILFAGLLNFIIGHGFSQWLPKILQVRGFSSEMSGYLAAIPVLTSIPANIIITRFTPPHLRPHIASLTAFISAIFLYLINISPSNIILVVSLAVYGFTFRCAMPLLMLVLMDVPQVGSKYMGTAAGLYFCISEIGGFAGPALMGIITDFTGTFNTGIFLMVGLTLVMTIAMYSIRQPYLSSLKNITDIN